MLVDRQSRLKLTDLLNAANSQYDNGYLSRYFDPKSGEPKEGNGDTLAEFIVRELRETFDEEACQNEQIASAVSVLERAAADVQNAIDGLKRSNHEDI